MTATTSFASPDYRAMRAVAAASIGNALQWFDFVAYGFFAATIGRLFFPAADQRISLLLALASFGVTFFMRPFGAVVLGAYADRRGRKVAFMVTILLMLAGTAIIAVAPTYATAGFLAPVLIVSGRLLQGFAAGAEFGSATAFLAEQNPQRRGFFASWQFASQGLTTILATAFGATLTSSLTPDQIASWGWRLPFIFGLLVGPVAIYIRRHVEETVEFRSAALSRTPFRQVLTDGKVRLVMSFGAIILCNVAMYTILFMPIYAAQQLGLPAAGGFLGGLVTGAIQVVLIPIVGGITDRHGRIPIAVASCLVLLLTIYPMFAWLAAVPTLQTLLIVQAIMGVLLSGYMGGLPALMSELFPTATRTTGLSVSYALSAAIFGGFAPFLDAWLIDATGSKLAPSFYLIVAALISLTALVAARRSGVR